MTRLIDLPEMIVRDVGDLHHHSSDMWRITAAELDRIVTARVADVADEIERLRAALESLTEDPPATFAREPDEDWEVIIKMRALARARLANDTRPSEVIVREARDAWPDRP